jgi:flavin-dependent dehydrogenase
MAMDSKQNQYDAIVIGGGPSGSTAASILAMHGRRVLLLEREKFPRYHIGESLLPYGYFPLERLGLLEKMKQSHYTKKYSVQFARQDGRVSIPFYFFDYFKHEAASTWQVLRSEFDEMLLNNSREQGVEVREETRVDQFIQDNGAVVGVRAVSATGEPLEFRAPVTIDATGRDALAAARNGWRIFDEKLKKIAVWTYYKGAKRDPGLDEGATTIGFLPEKGWFWYIPLAGDVVSVGAVGEKDYLFREGRDLKEVFHREVAANKWIESHLAEGEQFGPYRVTSEFSYRSKYTATNGLVLTGDAFGFLDPVFSSGVMLALKSGELCADAVHAALEAGDVSAERFTEYADTVRNGIETMRRIVYAFYDTEFSFRQMFEKYPSTRGDVTECLAGDLFRAYEDLFRAAKEFTEVPPVLPHGRPLTAELACASSS